jgi:hypothetical protein
MSEQTRPVGNSQIKIRVGFAIAIVGFLIYLLGVEPGLFGLDLSPVTGFVQIATFSVGLGILCFGGAICLSALWNGAEKTIAADIGLRLVSTGYVIAVASAMADVFGFGGQNLPREPRFGAWQAVGVMIGEGVIALGLLLLIPYRRYPYNQKAPEDNPEA